MDSHLILFKFSSFSSNMVNNGTTYSIELGQIEWSNFLIGGDLHKCMLRRDIETEYDWLNVPHNPHMLTLLCRIRLKAYIIWGNLFKKRNTKRKPKSYFCKFNKNMDFVSTLLNTSVPWNWPMSLEALELNLN
jgi:hypothetical protein